MVRPEAASNVLLLGKSGTGKDIFAQSIHNASDRKNGPYVAINCGAIPRDLIASELFGHEEGAFTGSRRGGNQGKFELADGGTIFLDEIAETPLELQTALLRVIEDKSVLRIGGTRVRPVDVRIIAATNKDLRDEVQKGNFREDLYYRANVFAIEMVPLCERLDDIPLLTDHFIKQCASAMKKNIARVDKKIMDVFMSYTWPGNVRETAKCHRKDDQFSQDDGTHRGDDFPRTFCIPAWPWTSKTTACLPMMRRKRLIEGCWRRNSAATRSLRASISHAPRFTGRSNSTGWNK